MTTRTAATAKRPVKQTVKTTGKRPAKAAKSTTKRPAKRTTNPAAKPTPRISSPPLSKHAADAKRYMDGVLSGEIVAGRLVIAAVKRHLDDLQKSAAGGPYVFDQAAGDHVINFIECLKHSTGEFAGTPFLLLPWQKFVLSVLFGWKKRADGLRRFREAFISLGRGNGKSPLAAAILLYLLTADRPPEARAEIKIAATERGKKNDNGGAMIVFNECARFISGSKALSKACKVLQGSIVFLKTEGTITPLGKEAKTKDGFNLHAYVADELHEWQAEHQGVWDKLETAMGKRRQPLAVSVTTAGSDRSALWKKKYDTCCKVVERYNHDDMLFVFIAQIDMAEPERDLPGDDPFDPACWGKANPNLGISVKVEHLQRMAEKARHDLSDRNNFLRYHLNVIVRSRLRIVNMDHWKACDTLELPELPRLICHGGIDLGWRDDIASFYLCFPLPDKRFAVKGWNWICEEAPKRDLQRDPWASWIASGRLIVTPGDVFDPAAIVDKVKWVRKQFRLQTIALDPHNARTVEIELVNDLGIKVYSFGQNPKKYNEPIKSALECVREQRLITGGDELLAWAASNMVVRSDSAGLMMPDKQRCDDKIDPIVAFLMAYSECLYAGSAPKPDYNERGLRRIRA